MGQETLAHELSADDVPRSISLSKDRSATSLRSRVFSSSSCFNRRILVGSSPANFLRHAK